MYTKYTFVNKYNNKQYEKKHRTNSSKIITAF